MARPCLSVDEVRSRFFLLGHTPTFDNSDYKNSQSKLSFICGSCGAVGATTCASISISLKKGTKFCSSCGHLVGVAAASAKVISGTFEEAITEARAKNFEPLFCKSDYHGATSVNLFVRCTGCENKFNTSLRDMRRMRGIGCSKCALGNSKSVLVTTKDGIFNYKTAAQKYGIPYGTFSSRKNKGWSDAQACGLEPRPPKNTSLDRPAYVYGWWSISQRKYVYVGLTVKSIESRTAEHIYYANRGLGAAFQELIRKDGSNSFEVHELWSGTVKDAAEVERKMIDVHETHISRGGYNVNNGGSLGNLRGRHIECENLKFESIREFTEYLGVTPKWVKYRMRKGFTFEQMLKEARPC